MAEPIKIHILFPFRDGPWGGCNQFLTALRQELRKVGMWASSPGEADIVLFDSYNAAADVIAWKRRLPDTPFIQRIDGPISRYRGADRHIDELIHALSAAVADGIVFQSRYSEAANLTLGMLLPRRSAVILNAASSEYFHRGTRPAEPGERVRLIASSWSSNWNKGFEVYRSLDEKLDFSRYQMTFVGNTPIRFQNIAHVPPQGSAELADLLRAHDVYLTASVDDPCSNSLIEAMACGLPAVALRSGGHPEIIGGGGSLFKGVDDVILAIEQVADRVATLRAELPCRSIAETAGDYCRFMISVHDDVLPPRKLSYIDSLKLLTLVKISSARSKYGGVRRRLNSLLVRGGRAQHVDSVFKTAARNAYRLACGSLAAINCLLPRRNALAVHYGGAREGDVGGPLVKVKRLSEHFPNHRLGYSLVYLLSNAPYMPKAALRLLKSRGIPIVLNQNGVFYPGWYAGDWRTPNRVMAEAFHAADWVFYQSEFCRRAAEKFLGSRHGPGEILYNAVDTSHFRPLPRTAAPRPFTFLITGKIGDHLAYRLESTIAGLAKARGQGLEARLVISGSVASGARRAAEELANRLAVADSISFTGRYRQEEAPAIYSAADAYVMTKYNDPCPNTVLEALACGLPVLYSNSGGVPELVGPDAGIGLDCGEEDWDRPHVPSAEAIAAGMHRIAAAPERYAAAARQKAVAQFDLGHWIDRHRAVFIQLLEQRT